VGGWDPQEWDLGSDLPLDDAHIVPGCELSESERLWIDAWDDFVQLMWEAQEGRRLPGFPLWADEWRPIEKLSARRLKREPRWKANYLQKNASFYSSHREVIDKWAARWGVYTPAFPPSRRKLEWQAQDTARLWDTVMHMRPSGIRAKAPTYLPALVAITQTSIVGPRERRLSPKEAARLQGLPEWFDFGEQPHWATYKQLGNGVSIGAVAHVFREHVSRDEEVLKHRAPHLLTPTAPGGHPVDASRPGYGRAAHAGQADGAMGRQMVRRPGDLEHERLRALRQIHPTEQVA
jgi:DNA (cytosine-5)-methyltransferase 1